MARRKTSRGTGGRLSAHFRISPVRHRSGAVRTGRRLRFESLETRRLLAITVDTIDDVVDANDGFTSLREAIVAANATAGEDTIEFAAALTAGGQSTIALELGEFEITESLSIDGPGAALLTIDAKQQSRIFNFTANVGDLALSGMKLTNGYEVVGGAIQSKSSGIVRLRDMVVHGNTAVALGGGVSASGFVSAHDSVISDNYVGYPAGDGGGIHAALGIELVGSRVEGNSASAYGGGIYVSSNGAQLKVVDSIIANNETRHRLGRGGGIFAVLSPTLTAVFENSTIRENSSNNGGGLYLFNGLAQFTDCVIASNTATNGGGIHARDVEMVRSEVSANVADGAGGGIYGTGHATVRESTFTGNDANFGGAIQSRSVTTIDSTLSGNIARLDGGAIRATASATSIRTTIASNVAGSRGGGIIAEVAALTNSIVADNQAANSGRDVYLSDPAGSVTAAYSLIGHAEGTTLVETGLGTPDASGNLVGGNANGAIDPLLAPLAYNGGFALPGGALLRTHALLSDSPALNAGNPNDVAGELEVPEFDQRGTPYGRVVGGRIDIGALEQRPAIQLQLVVDTLVDESDGDYSAGDLSLREAIELANASNFEGILDTISFDPQVFASPSTILLTLGALVITDSVEIEGLANTVIIVDASGNDPTPGEDNGDGTQVFVIDDLNEETLVDVSISGLTLQGGDAAYGGGVLSAENLTITGSRITDNASQTLGGGIFSVGGTLTLAESTVSQNRALLDGGGVASVANLFVTKSTISGNTAKSGGGVYLAGTTTIEHSQITSNAASATLGQGGGILAVSGPLTVFKSRVAGNSGFDGGGVYSDGSLEFVESTVSGNTAARNGGGILGRVETKVVRSNLFDNQAGGDGGGIFGREEVFVDSSTLARNTAGGDGGGAWLEANVSAMKLLQVTVSGNHAGGQGGGVWASNFNGNLTIAHSTIAYNEATDGYGGGIFALQGELDLEHTIVATNSAAAGPDLTGLLGASFDARYSLVGSNLQSGLTETTFGQADAKGNLVGGQTNGVIDPQLAPMMYYGGPTPIHALIPISLPLSNSPINAGNPLLAAGVAGVPEFDQRGAPFRRVPNTPVFGVSRIDIGAYELQSAQLVQQLFGDFNGNGLVDAADYTVWNDHLGQTVEANTLGDGNGDGGVDWADYEVWKWNYGRTASLSGAGSEILDGADAIGDSIPHLDSASQVNAVVFLEFAVQTTGSEWGTELPPASNNRHGANGADLLLLMRRRLRPSESTIDSDCPWRDSESGKSSLRSTDAAFEMIGGALLGI